MVEKVRSTSFDQGRPACFQPQLDVSAEDILDNGKLLIRLRPGISENVFFMISAHGLVDTCVRVIYMFVMPKPIAGNWKSWNIATV